MFHEIRRRDRALSEPEAWEILARYNVRWRIP